MALQFTHKVKQTKHFYTQNKSIKGGGQVILQSIKMEALTRFHHLMESSDGQCTKWLKNTSMNKLHTFWDGTMTQQIKKQMPPSLMT